jgi:hypothetical protein
MNVTKAALIVGGLLAASPAMAQSWANSPLNWQNSPLNYQNSPLNYNNSPLNYENSPLNYNSNRGIYDSDGNRWGYAVPREDGSGTNLFRDPD